MILQIKNLMMLLSLILRNVPSSGVILGPYLGKLEMGGRMILFAVMVLLFEVLNVSW